MQRNNYRKIQNFGANINSEVTSPLTYCINDTMSQKFEHGSSGAMIYGQNSKQCQAFLGEYCAQNWDEVCEYASMNSRKYFPDNLKTSSIGGRPYNLLGLTAGEMVVRNTAAVKYLISMGNCVPKFEPFDPTVANSPMIQTWVSNTGTYDCIPVYAVDATTIDNDVVMDKILTKPNIALDILINIYNNMQRAGLIESLANTKLGKFYTGNPTIFN